MGGRALLASALFCSLPDAAEGCAWAERREQRMLLSCPEKLKS
jgi:hypothetical protein